MQDFTREQLIAYSSVSTGIGVVASYYGIKNWKKNGWWKALGVVGVIQTAGGLSGLAMNLPKNSDKQLNK